MRIRKFGFNIFLKFPFLSGFLIYTFNAGAIETTEFSAGNEKNKNAVVHLVSSEYVGSVPLRTTDGALAGFLWTTPARGRVPVYLVARDQTELRLVGSVEAMRDALGSRFKVIRREGYACQAPGCK